MIEASLCYSGISGYLVGDCGESHALLTCDGIASDFLEFRIVLTVVSQLPRCPCLPLLGRVMLLQHLPYPARAVESLKEVAESPVFQLLPVKIPVCDVRQPCDLCIGIIGILTKDIIDFEYEIWLALGGHLLSANLHSFL